MEAVVIKSVLSILSVGMELYKDNVKTNNAISLENTQTQNKVLLDTVRTKNECGKILTEEGTKVGGRIVDNVFGIVKSDKDETLRERMIRFDKEMEALEKDRELQRRKDVLDSVKQYQIEVTNVIKESMMILAAMPLELQKRAALMLDEEQDKYMEREKKWRKDAMNDLEEIEHKFSGNERLKERMEDAIMDGLNAMIQSAKVALGQMNEDVKAINENARRLSKIGAEQARYQMQPLQGKQMILIDEKKNEETGVISSNF